MAQTWTHRYSRSNGGPILPTAAGTKVSDLSRAGFLSKRYVRLFLGCVGAFWLFVLFCREEEIDIPVNVPILHELPPLYESYHQYERNLPQHNLSLPFPEGRDAKFFWAANHVHESGWGNAMQELLVNSLLAYHTKRAFVFNNYTWEEGPDYSHYNGKLIPARIPLSSLISGPTIGAPFPPGDDSPRAVSREYFKSVCPNPTIIDSNVVNEHLRTDPNVPAITIFERWVEKLNSMDDPCVEIDKDSYQLFEIWLFGTKRILSLWPLLSESPILQQFSYSPLILNAYNENADLFEGPLPEPSFLSWLFGRKRPTRQGNLLPLHDVTPHMRPAEVEPSPGLLVLHVRRGDFKQHCEHLAKWSSDWNGFNQFAALPDRFQPPVPTGWGETTDEARQMYLRRCFPDVDQIVYRVREVMAERDEAARREGRRVSELKRVYVMTNGKADWLEELKTALGEIKEWDAVLTSRDMVLDWEAKPVAQAVDMLIGQKAQVFIGNGFSSLTSNVVMFRMLQNLPPQDTRFW